MIYHVESALVVPIDVAHVQQNFTFKEMLVSALVSMDFIRISQLKLVIHACHLVQHAALAELLAIHVLQMFLKDSISEINVINNVLQKFQLM